MSDISEVTASLEIIGKRLEEVRDVLTFLAVRDMKAGTTGLADILGNRIADIYFPKDK